MHDFSQKTLLFFELALAERPLIDQYPLNTIIEGVSLLNIDGQRDKNSCRKMQMGIVATSHLIITVK